MKDSILERLKSVIATKSNSPNDFSKKIGIAPTTFNNQLKSPRGISVDVILLTLAAYPDISAEWLLRGKGEMILSDNLPPIIGDESENDLDTHAMLAQARIEIDRLNVEVASLKKEQWKKEGVIEYQKDLISELTDELKELKLKLPQETKKDIV